MVVIKHSCFCESPRSIRNSCTVSQTQRLIGKKVSFMTTRACITSTAQWNIYCMYHRYLHYRKLKRMWETSVIVFFWRTCSAAFHLFCRVQFFVGSDALESHLLVALFGKYFIGKPLMHFPEKRWSSLRIVSILKYTIDCCYVIVQQQQEIVVLYLQYIISAYFLRNRKWKSRICI